ncbi:S8 family serine peptidase [Deinococcus sp. S9]|uniref:S8 family peptidase n=1 Tax=Deinococcus sp. S9 TaxID=2545754 RepID=UPI0010564767|nr:S8 family serine peptidase [Deinococcus sp. S9]TDE85744.1 peptidase S8 [Deinococcus sp. S9]
MTRLLALPLLTLALTLVACGGTTPTDSGAGDSPNNALLCAQVTSSAGLTGAARPTAAAPSGWAAPHVPGQVLVASGTLSTQGLSVLSTVRTQQVTPELRLAWTPAGETDAAFAARLAAAGLRVQPNFIYQPLALPNDPGYPGNGGVADPAGATQDYLNRIHVAGAWGVLEAQGKMPVGALTALLDTGVDASHPDLEGRLLPGVTFMGTASLADATGHGTATAGLLGAATNNGLGLAGVTWTGRTVLSVNVQCGGGITTAALAQGLAYAVAQGAKVINMSLGVSGNPGDAELEAALDRAAESAVLVAAAGNTSGDGVYYPASNPNVIAVGALGARDDELACYSARPNDTRKRALDIVAPGGAGAGACPGATSDEDLLVLAPGGGYQRSAGTSEAAPLVSGVAALMRAANPALTAAQTRERLLASVDRSGGLPRLDAEAAVRAATR